MSGGVSGSPCVLSLAIRAFPWTNRLVKTWLSRCTVDARGRGRLRSVARLSERGIGVRELSAFAVNAPNGSVAARNAIMSITPGEDRLGPVDPVERRENPVGAVGRGVRVALPV